MQQHAKRDISEQTQTPSLQYVCAVARLLQSDPTDILSELGYFRPEAETDASLEESPRSSAQEKDAERSEYYVG